MWVLIDPVLGNYNRNMTLTGSCSVVEMRGWLSFTFELKHGLCKLALKLKHRLG